MSVPVQVRLCQVGCGHWGKNLVRNFNQLDALYAVCESNDELRATFQTQYPNVRAYSRLEEVLADPVVNAIAIATPAETHAHMAIAALKAGRDVFVEKPLALEAEDGLAMVQAARESSRILMVGHLLKYHPGIRKLQELVSSPSFGRLEYIYSNRLSMGKIRREENALWSFAPHDISVILALVGRLPVQVTATGGAYLQPNIADITVSTLLFDDGTRAHIFVSWLHPYKEQRLVVVGSKQMAVFEDSRPDNKLLLFEKKIEWKNGVPHASGAAGQNIPFDPAEPLSLECAHFLDCVAKRKKPHTPAEEGVEVLQVLQSCQRSLQTNGHPEPVFSLATARQTR